MIQDKIRILSDILGGSFRSNDEFLFRCPSCGHHKNKLSVKFSTNVFKCWICDYRGKSIRRIVRRFGSRKHLQEWDSLFGGRHDLSEHINFSLFAEKEPEVKEHVDLPESFKTLASKYLSPAARPALAYLKKRGISADDILRYKIGYATEGEFAKRIVIPSFDSLGDLNYFIARAYDGNWSRYKNPPVSRDVIFNELTVDWDSDLVLVEGVFDAINAGNAIPILGSSLRPTSKLFKAIVMNDTPVFMALDNDAKKKENRIINDLLKYDVEVYKIDTSGYDDVGEMPKEVFETRKKGAEFVSADSYMLYEAIGSI